MRLVLMASLAVLLVAACGSDDDPGPAGGGSSSGGPATPGTAIPEAQLLAQYTAAYCETLGPCCTKYSVPFDKTTCTTLVTNVLKPPLEDAKTRGRTYDADAAGQCVASIRAAITACDAGAIRAADLANTADNRGSICRRIYKGTKKVDEACDSTSDCAQPAGKVVVCATNLCREYEVGSAGAACKATYDEEKPEPYVDCGETLECKTEDGESGVCAAPEPKPKGTAKEGAACKRDSDCVTNRCFQEKCFTDKMGISPEACAKPLN